MQKKAINKKSLQLTLQAFFKIWRRPTLPHVTAVPSALAGLTSLFGMGRGGHRRYRHLNIFNKVEGGRALGREGKPSTFVPSAFRP